MEQPQEEMVSRTQLNRKKKRIAWYIAMAGACLGLLVLLTGVFGANGAPQEAAAAAVAAACAVVPYVAARATEALNQ